MAVAGFSLGCAFSVKWVGLFVIALVGLRTLRDLWDLLGDLRNTKVGLHTCYEKGIPLMFHITLKCFSSFNLLLVCNGRAWFIGITFFY